MTLSKELKNIDKKIKQSILADNERIAFFDSYFLNQDETKDFIRCCLKKINTRRAMLRIGWYTDIAEKIATIKPNSSSLQIVFIMAIAESIGKLGLNKIQANNIGSQKAVKIFFSNISEKDKQFLIKKMQRTLSYKSQPALTLRSIIKILYNVRNEAVHGNDFWSFSFAREIERNEIEKYEAYYASTITHGKIGSKRRKTLVSIQQNLSYKDFRDIVVRTGIKTIQNHF